MAKERLPWRQWKAITKRIYLNRWNDWPEAIMRCHYNEGYSPLKAYDTETAKRVGRWNLSAMQRGRDDSETEI